MFDRVNIFKGFSGNSKSFVSFSKSLGVSCVLPVMYRWQCEYYQIEGAKDWAWNIFSIAQIVRAKEWRRAFCVQSTFLVNWWRCSTWTDNTLWPNGNYGLGMRLTHESQDLASVGQHDLRSRRLITIILVISEIRQLSRLSLNIIHSAYSKEKTFIPDLLVILKHDSYPSL